MQIPKPIIQRSHRSSISLRITSEGELIVKAPKLLPGFLINKFLEQKSDWITTVLAKVKSRKPSTHVFKEGESFLVFGKQYIFTPVDSVEIIAKEGKLHFPKALLFRAKKEMENWYMHLAKDTITRRVEFHAKQMKAEYKSIMFSDTKSKWGTCTHDNHLQFNWRLVMAPLLVLDYVVIHELTHTTEKNHARQFWKSVEQFTPAYRQHRKWLDEHGHLLHV